MGRREKDPEPRCRLEGDAHDWGLPSPRAYGAHRVPDPEGTLESSPGPRSEAGVRGGRGNTGPARAARHLQHLDRAASLHDLEPAGGVPRGIEDPGSPGASGGGALAPGRSNGSSGAAAPGGRIRRASMGIQHDRQTSPRVLGAGLSRSDWAFGGEGPGVLSPGGGHRAPEPVRLRAGSPEAYATCNRNE